MIECQICKGMFGALSGKHLKKHNITAEQYRKMFPGHITRVQPEVLEETRAKMSAKRTGAKHSEETKAKIGAKHKGKVIAVETVERQKASYQQFLKNNGGSPQKGYKRSEKFSEHMREVALARSPELVQQKVEQMWAARRGSKATDEQKDRYSDARLKYIEENPDKIFQKLFNTVPEQEFEQELINHNISYKRSVRIGNRLFDFQLNNDILVEIDGPYHYDYKMYGNKSMSDQERMMLFEEGQQRDRYKDQLAIDNGFKIYRIQVGRNLPKNWKEIIHQQGCLLF